MDIVDQSNFNQLEILQDKNIGGFLHQLRSMIINLEISR